MNAKKIMGAVLIALLAAALFVGAGAAATVFVYQTGTDNGADDYAGTWGSANGGQVIIDNQGNVTPVGTFVPGLYENESGAKLSIVYPTATISGTAGSGPAAYPFIGANLYEGEQILSITNVSASTNVKPDAYLLTFPNTTTVVVKEGSIVNVVKDLPKGTYKLAVQFNYTDFALGTDGKYLKTEPVSFSVVEADDATITASVDKIIKGETFTITITGKPGVAFLVNGTKDAFKITPNQVGIGIINDNVTFVMPNSGSVSYTLAGNIAVSGTEQTLKLWSNATGDKNGIFASTGEKITVKFEKGTLSAKTEKASYFVGDDIVIVGTTTAGIPTKIKINGTNFGYVNIINANDYDECDGDAVQTFELTLKYADISNQEFTGKKLDVGTYTITLIVGDVEAAIPLTLKQPFITIAEAPEVIVQGEEDVEFIINAEASPNGIGYYIFGTNYFTGNTGVVAHPEDEDGEDILNQFVVPLSPEASMNMAPGQYFAVFQHPMYDKAFNVSVAGDWKINVNNDYTIDVKDRQTANAAQALCDALDMQGIDDMYAKASFFIVGKDQSFTLSEIPTTIAQGETLTISGVSTANAEKYVTVEMISTAFAAVPKETVGSAAFIAVTTQIAEDGTWEVTLDTSDLNVDEYSLKVACSGEDKPWKNVNINVVEGADTPDTPDTPDVPDTPDTPDEPEAPATPGFGALAALAGLGAVAVLLLRRE